MAASACTPNPLKEHAGTYCIESNSDALWGCFYLKENGRGSVDSFMGSGNIEWELLSENKIKIVNSITKTGLSLTISNDGSKLNYYHVLWPISYHKQGLTAANKENKALISLSCALNSLSSPIKAIYDRDNAYFKAGDISPQERIAPEDAVVNDTEAYEYQILSLKGKGTYSMKRIKEIMEKRGMPTIDVLKGDIIAREGEAISPAALEVMDYFGYSKKSMQYLIKESWKSCMSKSNS